MSPFLSLSGHCSTTNYKNEHDILFWQLRSSLSFQDKNRLLIIRR
jgi:hypothetical protein